MPRCDPFKSKTPVVKGALCSFEEEILIRAEIFSLTKKTIYTVLLCLYVADPATFQCSGDFISLWTACLFTYWDKFVLLPH